MSGCAEAASQASFRTPSKDARAARLAKFEREKLIVDYLNRGVSIAEIATRIEVGEKRTRAIIREILARRMPAPPKEFVAIQVSRLNEALLVAFSAMTDPNLKAVDSVVRIVRELDRYHGFSAARRLPDPPTAVQAVEAPVQGALTFGAALVGRPEFPTQGSEKIEFTPGFAKAPEAPVPVEAPLGQAASPGLVPASGLDPGESKDASAGPGESAFTAAERKPGDQDAGRPVPSAGFGGAQRPEIPAQVLEKMGFAPGPANASAVSSGADSTREAARASAGRESGRFDGSASAGRPENPSQSFENRDSTPGIESPATASSRSRPPTSARRTRSASDRERSG